mmetsp:Transcript_8132/g.23107  ORF Transcript_8132/g.23107 Transcript_8132/m.23107 type:complete len:225 (+) Transcript_8132:1272-1946(+)
MLHHLGTTSSTSLNPENILRAPQTRTPRMGMAQMRGPRRVRVTTCSPTKKECSIGTWPWCARAEASIAAGAASSTTPSDASGGAGGPAATLWTQCNPAGMRHQNLPRRMPSPGVQPSGQVPCVFSFREQGEGRAQCESVMAPGGRIIGWTGVHCRLQRMLATTTPQRAQRGASPITGPTPTPLHGCASLSGNPSVEVEGTTRRCGKMWGVTLGLGSLFELLICG